MAHRRLHYDPYRDYFIILGISPYATSEEIQHAYRKRAKALHPDRNPAPDATLQFQLLNEAYEVLKNAETRYLYGALRNRAHGLRFEMPSEMLWPKRNPVTGHRQHWRAVLSGLLTGPYRAVYMVLGVVSIASLSLLLAIVAGGSRLALPSSACGAQVDILQPLNDSTVGESFDVVGTVPGAYHLDWSADAIPDSTAEQVESWHLLAEGSGPVDNGLLAARDQTVALPGGQNVKLRLSDFGGDSCMITVRR